MLRVLAAYLAAVLVTYTGAVVAHSQSVVARLADMGVDESLPDRLGHTLHDLTGMAGLFLPIIAVTLAIAFLVASQLMRLLPRWRPVGYAVAGGVAMLAVHVILEQTLAITPIAAARTTLGMTLQALAGVLGGWVFTAGLGWRATDASTTTAGSIT
jgi:hypothetical protein